jgi:hypothetical protein
MFRNAGSHQPSKSWMHNSNITYYFLRHPLALLNAVYLWQMYTGVALSHGANWSDDVKSYVDGPKNPDGFPDMTWTEDSLPIQIIAVPGAALVIRESGHHNRRGRPEGLGIGSRIVIRALRRSSSTGNKQKYQMMPRELFRIVLSLTNFLRESLTAV